MRRIIFYIFVFIAVLIGIFFYVGRINAPADNNLQGLNWIEIFAPSSGNGIEEAMTGRKIYSGDEIMAPIILKTESSESANIYLANGSVIRLGGNTEIELDKAVFNFKKNALAVKIILKTGQIWSKIVGSPGDSSWEVKTDNAVVFGQVGAFGVEYSEGKTLLVVAENKAALTVVDPEKENNLADSTVSVSSNEIIEINDSDIEEFKIGKKTVKNFIRQESSVWQQAWISNCIIQDMVVNNKISSFKSGGLDTLEIQKALIKNNLQEMQKQLSGRITAN
ncbi:MAG: hypothetical protein COU29_00915 [Candidatus Magasanikbacteria bacterium CG10_big_fil_rev_8_21_14_0_10_36_32]|uniref:FecR protein domain-containing protein n=1 Tax=Candidatus Magasanikbacteria bacterium CG10_big_fil_rev_8_21_14_0_10_36_32 TaxID=1974646 RepID=A0A2M6W6A8_9BACT|nr:MAG: hypothetical protein COU29_00915 [Candidatus Magasanikbacteria bacterium CG10_big_fil_rev_8_21_14_0_10_36_32]